MQTIRIPDFLEQTIYSWDVSSLLGGIVDYLEFSEQNLSWQRQRERRRAEEEALSLEFDEEDAHLLPQARAQIVEGAEYRFDIGLSQSIRFGGLVAYVTSIEWCAKLFAGRMVLPVPKCPKGKNDAAHTLQHLVGKIGGKHDQDVAVFESVVHVRNCVVHSAGLVKGDRHESAVRAALSKISGFGISTEGFLGERAHIDAGAIERLARSALAWVPALDMECTTNGTFRR